MLGVWYPLESLTRHAVSLDWLTIMITVVATLSIDRLIRHYWRYR